MHHLGARASISTRCCASALRSAFWIADADVVADATPELGGSVMAAPLEAAGFRPTVLADPQGAVFSATQLLLPA